MRHHRSTAQMIAGVAGVAGVAAILALGVLVAEPAGAGVFTVTTTSDTLDGNCDAHCSLREAIVTANGTPGPDEVRLGPGLFRLTLDAGVEDAAATGDLDVTDDLTLTGAGAASTTIDGGGIDRILDVHFLNSGDVAVADLTLRNGHARAPSEDGGAISSQSRLTITRCHVAVNVADGAGGGIFLVFGDLVVRDSTISGNTAGTAGGGIASLRGQMEFVNVTISGNRAQQSGGGIAGESFSPGFGTITSSTITDNLAPRGGGIIAFPAVPETTDPDPELEHTIVAGNSSLKTPECSVTLDPNHNLVALLATDGSCPSPSTPFDLRLAPLGFYGGPTPTHALLAGSPAIDAGLPAPGAGSCAATDQRGRARPADGDGDGTVRCDVGAFERDASCATEGGTLCLGGRFRATARWTTPQGASGAGQAVSLTSETGYFWFFDPANVEVVVKALDACVPPFDRFWVFAAGLTNVEVELTVEDTDSGQVKTYSNPQGRPFQPILDTDAFETCP